jgi:hypothetical protein
MAEAADTPLPSYYGNQKSWRIQEAVRNFDDPSNIGFFTTSVSNARSRNFFVDFGDEEAWCGFDLEAEDYASLLKTPVSRS